MFFDRGAKVEMLIACRYTATDVVILLNALKDLPNSFWTF